MIGRHILLSVLLLGSSSAMALPSFLDDGSLSAEGCAYGRGALAVEDAKANAWLELAVFLKSPSLFTEALENEELDTATAQWLRQLHDKAVEGLQLLQLPVTLSGSRIEGNDTCVTISLARGTLPGYVDDAGGWDSEIPEVIVTVSGEGWPDPDNGLTARRQAEQEALRRAVSLVVGVWLTHQRAKFFSLEERATGDNRTISLQDVVSQQLHSRSESLVKEWSLLDSRKLEWGGVAVTIQAVVEKQKLASAAKDVLTLIASPRVAVAGPDAVVRPLEAWLTENGIEVGRTASLRIRADAQLKASGKTRLLDLTVTVEDLSGQQYGFWRNDPSLLALPDSPNALADLIAAHLALPEQKAALHAELQQAFQAMVAHGGLIREIRIRKTLLREADKLHAILATLGGARDVSVGTEGNFHRASLRYAGTTGELVGALQQALQPIVARTLPQAKIFHEYEIIFD